MATTYQPTFGDTTIIPELVLKAWAKSTWDFGRKDSYFSKFMGSGRENIIQVMEDLSRGKGTSIEVSLIMPLNGAGVIEDKQMEGNEERMNYRSCTVYLSRVRNAIRLEGRFEEQKTQEKMRTDMRKLLSRWIARYFDLSIFAVLTGTQPPFVANGTLELPYTIEPPTADRMLFGGNATSEASITAADTFSADLIGKARRMAQKNELTCVILCAKVKPFSNHIARGAQANIVSTILNAPACFVKHKGAIFYDEAGTKTFSGERTTSPRT